MLHRLSRSCYRRRRAVLGVWAVAPVALFGLNAAFGGRFLDDFAIPGSESQPCSSVAGALASSAWARRARSTPGCR